MRSGFIFGDDKDLPDGPHAAFVNGKLKTFWTAGNIFLTSDKNKKDPGIHSKFINGKLTTYFEDGFGNINKMF